MLGYRYKGMHSSSGLSSYDGGTGIAFVARCCAELQGSCFLRREWLYALVTGRTPT